MEIKAFLDELDNGKYDNLLSELYGKAALSAQKKRYATLIHEFMKKYPARKDIHIFSASGRTEIGGNHTDHQHGCVLAAAVNLDVIAVVGFHDEKVIRVKSAGYPEDIVKLDDLNVHLKEKGSSAMIRGIAYKFSELGAKIGGFDACTTSDVLSGSGISSSAAFEVLIGTIMDKYYMNGRIGAVEIAKIGQFAENVYFGKKSGLMDQMVSSVGGFVAIDFNNTEAPEIKSCSFDFEKSGYCLFITDTKGSHADLTDDYVAIPAEMKKVATYFDKEVLRDVSEEDFYEQLPKLRKTCSDRAILRAAHFIAENKRAILETEAIKNGNMDYFLRLVRESGESSEQLLQNLYSCKKPTEQAIPLGIMLSRRFLGDRGAVRVHGGGFAGTIQAFVPLSIADGYCSLMDSLYGKGSCIPMRIRPYGGIEITI